jgi:hypothetical protein
LKLNGRQQFLVNVRDVNLVGDNINTTKHSVIFASKEADLGVFTATAECTLTLFTRKWDKAAILSKLIHPSKKGQVQKVPQTLQQEEHRLRVFGVRALRRMHEPMRDEVTEDWRKFTVTSFATRIRRQVLLE